MKIDREKGFFNVIKTNDKKASIDMYGEIVDEQLDDVQTSAVSFKQALNSLGDVEEIDININSPGGSVFSGIAIYNMIKNHPAKITAHVQGLAASIATCIAMAADKVVMPSNSMLMIHNAWSMGIGNAKDLRKLADDLDKINQTIFQSYIDKNPKIDHAILQNMMDEETWLTASECKELGLIDEVKGATQIAAKISPEMEAKFKNMPNNFKYYNVDDPEPKEPEPKEKPDNEVINDKLDDIFKLLKDVADEVIKDDEDEGGGEGNEPKPPSEPQNKKFNRFLF